MTFNDLDKILILQIINSIGLLTLLIAWFRK
jgi:hypothetical protein